jgi:hypothetical protein
MRRVRRRSAQSQQSAAQRATPPDLPLDDGTVTAPGGLAMPARWLNQVTPRPLSVGG